MCPSGYTPLMEDIWPGTVDGCNCKVITNSSVPVQYANQINRMTCTSLMLKTGCKNVPQISQKELFYWQGVFLCGKTGQKNYQYYYKNVGDKNLNSTSCPVGFKQCGVLDSIGNLLCEEGSQDCPVNKLLIKYVWEDEPKDYNYTKLRVDNNKSVYSTNQAIGEKVLTEVKLSEGSVCIHPGEINHQFNLKQYILDKEYFNNNCSTNIAGTK